MKRGSFCLTDPDLASLKPGFLRSAQICPDLWAECVARDSHILWEGPTELAGTNGTCFIRRFHRYYCTCCPHRDSCMLVAHLV